MPAVAVDIRMRGYDGYLFRCNACSSGFSSYPQRRLQGFGDTDLRSAKVVIFPTRCFPSAATSAT
jgi:hypothetical protein